ncbi:MAG TPA: DUF924 family protein [Acetobacteraceae bacterium]|jgi:uncharacterized protein (DUF924 family)
MTTADDVLSFWFEDDPRRWRKVWFVREDAFDAACTEFADASRAARDGAFDHWAETPRSMLALIILLDQFSRNLHRGSGESYAADAQARALARRAVAQGFDRQLGWVERIFVYLPFEHSENLADQDEGVRLFETLRIALGDSGPESAYRHRGVIRRFGRFPHRNGMMGRDSTDAERAFMAAYGRGF